MLEKTYGTVSTRTLNPGINKELTADQRAIKLRLADSIKKHFIRAKKVRLASSNPYSDGDGEFRMLPSNNLHQNFKDLNVDWNEERKVKQQ